MDIFKSQKMEKTIVQMECVSIKKLKGWKDGKTVPAYQIELAVAYDNNSEWYQLSGGSNNLLNTVNEEAAKMFEVGENYLIEISKIEK